jgi:hypothetical protein
MFIKININPNKAYFNLLVIESNIIFRFFYKRVNNFSFDNDCKDMGQQLYNNILITKTLKSVSNGEKYE